MTHVKLAAALAVLTIIVFHSILFHDFIKFDTYRYIVNNDHVNSGLSLGNVQWAFTAFHVANWHPLTWLSHMLDVSLFGLNPTGHLGVNLLIHTLNVLLLFQLLRLMTGQMWPAVFIAALFAIHPAHVESVAWVAERKDLLSTLFLLLTLFAWRYYTRTPSIPRYALVTVLFALGLMAKPMVVTLPFILLLFDYWPLDRMTGTDVRSALRRFGTLLYEKLPLFILSLLSAIITWRAQQSGGAMYAGAELGLAERVGNAIIAYGYYIKTALLPADLALLYPHPGSWPPLLIGANLALIIVISITAIFWIRQFPWLFVGWAFFLGTLVPVIGLVQVGAQAYADRYTYIPYIGLFIAVTFGVREIFVRFAIAQSILRYGAVCLVAAYAIAAIQYVSHWQNSITIWTHTLLVTDKNYPILVGLEPGTPDRTKRRIGLFKAYYMLARSLSAAGYYNDALLHFDEALSLNPDNPSIHYFKGFTLLAMNRHEEALAAFDKVTELDPGNRAAMEQIKTIRKALLN